MYMYWFEDFVQPFIENHTFHLQKHLLYDKLVTRFRDLTNFIEIIWPRISVEILYLHFGNSDSNQKTTKLISCCIPPPPPLLRRKKN